MKNTKSNEKKNRFAEFSKFILILFAICYFVGGAFVLWVVYFQLTHTLTPEYISAGDVVAYFTAPITAGLVIYFGKAAVENYQKIKGNVNSENDSLSSQSNRIVKG